MWISIVWAVAIELRFYLIAGLVMGLAQRKPGIAVPVLGAAGCTALLGYIVTYAYGYQILGTFRHAPYFVLGATGYFAIAYSSTRAYFLAIIAALMSAHSFWQYHAATPDLSGLKLLLFASSVCAMLLLARTPVSSGSVPNDKKLGDFSYPLYLAHWPAVFLVENASTMRGGAGYALVVLISIVFSTLMVVGIDRPLMNLRDRVRRRRLYA